MFRLIKKWFGYLQDGILLPRHNLIWLWPWQRCDTARMWYDLNISDTFRSLSDFWDFWDGYSATHLNDIDSILNFLLDCGMHNVSRHNVLNNVFLVFFVPKHIKHRDRIMGVLSHLDTNKFKIDCRMADEYIRTYVVLEVKC